MWAYLELLLQVILEIASKLSLVRPSLENCQKHGWSNCIVFAERPSPRWSAWRDKDGSSTSTLYSGQAGIKVPTTSVFFFTTPSTAYATAATTAPSAVTDTASDDGQGSSYQRRHSTFGPALHIPYGKDRISFTFSLISPHTVFPDTSWNLGWSVIFW